MLEKQEQKILSIYYVTVNLNYVYNPKIILFNQTHFANEQIKTQRW